MDKDSPVKKILILAANPKNTTRLRLDEEVRRIRERIRLSTCREQFNIQQEGAVRLDDLRGALLNHEPQIVHFCGHGEEDGLMLEDEDGTCKLVRPEALANLFELFANKIECIVLNACYSDRQAKAIAAHIQYVIGMSQAIGDKAAVKFAVGFYDGLGAGRSYEIAYQFGRNAIQLEDIPEGATPILWPKTLSSVSSAPLGTISSVASFSPPTPSQEILAAEPALNATFSVTGRDSAEWSDDDWRKLLLNIQQQNCVLMLGPDIPVQEAGDQAESLTKLLARELANELLELRPDMRSWNIDFSNLAQVAQYYCMGLEKGRTELEEKVLAFYEKWQDQPIQIYTALADLPFYLTITTTPDALFYQALQKSGKRPFTRNYHGRRKAQEILDEPTVDHPLIFHLYGMLETPGSLILTENNLLDFLVKVSSKNPSLPEYILSELRDRDKTLLFLGFGFRHWYLRILLHVLLQGETRKDRFSYALEPLIPPGMQDTVFFFKKSEYHIQICRQELARFVKELRERYQASISSKNQIQSSPLVHICHVTEDIPVVLRLYEQLQAQGFRLWPSSESLGKENIHAQILDQMERVAIDYFVVLQTQSFPDHLDEFLKIMIDRALERQKACSGGARFVIPVTIGDSVPLEELGLFHTPDISVNIDELVKVMKQDQQRRQKRRL